MLQQLDLFGGDPIKLTGKPAESKKKSYKIAPPVQVVEEPSIEESSTSIQTIDVDDFSAPALKKGKKDRSQAVKKITDIAMLDIPEDSILYSKQYYPIGEVAAMFRVNISLIRFWENEFDILKPRKNRKGDRFFRPDDVKNLKLIYFLLKERKYTISGAKSFIKSGKKVNERFEAIESLKNIRAMLLELKAGLL
ncbi:MAG: MerR family transcriptional regulator [bacterium]|jgi:DNA-binding transcriptional MerR regulator|nr:MerR family transcriptional regulator [Chitinophagaceae bacterium]